MAPFPRNFYFLTFKLQLNIKFKNFIFHLAYDYKVMANMSRKLRLNCITTHVFVHMLFLPLQIFLEILCYVKFLVMQGAFSRQNFRNYRANKTRTHITLSSGELINLISTVYLPFPLKNFFTKNTVEPRFAGQVGKHTAC